MDELAFADPFGIIVAGVVEAVYAHLDKAVILHVVDLQRSGDEFARDLAADVFLDAVGQSRLAQGDAALIVVELDIVHKEGCELVKVAPVVSIEQRSIKSGAGAVKLLLTLNLVE